MSRAFLFTPIREEPNYLPIISPTFWSNLPSYLASNSRSAFSRIPLSDNAFISPLTKTALTFQICSYFFCSHLSLYIGIFWDSFNHTGVGLGEGKEVLTAAYDQPAVSDWGQKTFNCDIFEHARTFRYLVPIIRI